MQVTQVGPGQRLAPFVRRFTVVESDVEVTRALLPEHGLILGVRFGGSASMIAGDVATRVPDASLVGIVGATRRMRTSAGGGVVLAVFRETGAARFFAEPLHELFGRTLALGELVPRAELARVQQRIAEAPDHPRRIAILEQFLIARLRPDGADRIAEAAVAAIRQAHGSLRIAQLARALGISQDPLEKRFRRTVGTSPKQLASLMRLRHVIDRIDPTRAVTPTSRLAALVDRHGRRPGELVEQTRRLAALVDPIGRRRAVSWSRLAIEAGYFDQSHFIREFRTVTGASPAQFFRADSYC